MAARPELGDPYCDLSGRVLWVNDGDEMKKLLLIALLFCQPAFADGEELCKSLMEATGEMYDLAQSLNHDEYYDAVRYAQDELAGDDPEFWKLMQLVSDTAWDHQKEGRFEVMGRVADACLSSYNDNIKEKT
jgi:hypothetical protein